MNEEKWIYVARRGDAYTAQAAESTLLWDSGPTPEAAIRNLERTWPETKGRRIEYVRNITKARQKAVDALPCSANCAAGKHTKACEFAVARKKLDKTASFI